MDTQKNENVCHIPEEKFSKVFHSAPLLMSVSKLSDGTYLEVNEMFEKISGFSRKEAIGKTSIELGWISKEDRSRMVENLKSEGRVRNMELVLRAKGGKEIDCAYFGEIIKMGEEDMLLSIALDRTEEKKAKEALKRYGILYKTSADAIMTLEPPEWKFTSGNPATIKMFNAKDEKEFTSLGPWELSPEKQPDGQLSSDKSKTMIERAMREGSNFFEWTHKRYKGEDFPATVLLTKVKIGDRELLQATVRDISKEKETRAGYEALFNFGVDAIFIADIKTKKLVDCNKAAEKLTGRTKEEIISMNADELHPEDIRQKTMEGFKAQAEGKIKIIKSEVLTKNGKRIPVAISAAPLRIKNKNYAQGIFRDISENKKAEEELNNKMEELEKMNRLMVGRELKMVELKKEIAQLKGEKV